MTVGQNSFITDLVHLAGGRNVFDDVPNAYFNVPPELAVSRNPDLLLSLTDDAPGTLAPLLAKNPGWAATRAIRENRVIEGLPLDIILRPSPRVLEAIGALRDALKKFDNVDNIDNIDVIDAIDIIGKIIFFKIHYLEILSPKA
jgi:iron complex transport system substrate-binding protein